MVIKLIPAPMFNDTSRNVETLRRSIDEHKEADLLVFGEAFLQGFDGLTWDVEEDKDIALSLQDDVIKVLRGLAEAHSVAVSFGFYEKEQRNIYSSNLCIDKNGDILDVYRRVSKTWTPEHAGRHYKTGDDFHTFHFMDKKLLMAICGDLWFAENLDRINELEPDLILWPLYIDYSIEEWSRGEKDEYARQVSGLNAPVLMVNSFLQESKGAVGGAYLFDGGAIKDSLPLGEIGSLTITIE